ncbi:MAG: anti-sigma-I factor RsgI family protein [Romboutsia sp.]|uniref:anti-sigma-I factor RsgI family protein n=1 Tax=Romboutsia sp. TaxID=1965302 RepID=UPI003F30D6C6
MEDNIFKMLDDLTIEEVSLLLEQNFNLHIDSNAKNRIANSVIEKSNLDFNYNNSCLNKLKNIFNSFFTYNKLVQLSTIFIIFLGIGRYACMEIPIAYISIDMNPSIELGINRFNKVVSSKYYNKEGEILLESSKNIDTDINQVLDSIIDTAIEKEYITNTNDSSIAFASIAYNVDRRENLESTLKHSIEDHLNSNSINSNILSFNATLNKRKEATKLGFTTSKLVLVEELKSLDTNVLIKEFKDMPVITIENKILELKNYIPY